jgi:gliding motility-associated-like protein
MIPKRLLIVLCSIGLSIATTMNAYSQTRVHANVLVGNSSDFVNAELAVDLNWLTCAYLDASLGVLTNSHIQMRFQQPGKAGDVLNIPVQTQGLLSAGVLNNLTLRLYNPTGVNVANFSGSSLLELSLLSSGNNMYTIRCFTDPNANYEIAEVRLELASLLSVHSLSDFRVYGAFLETSCPPVFASSVHASGSSATPSLLSGYVTNPSQAVDGNINTAAALIVPLNALGLLPPAYLEAAFAVPGKPGDRVGVTVSQSSSLLSLSLLGNITLTAYNAAGGIVASQAGFTLLDLQLLSGTTDKYTLAFNTPSSGSYEIHRLRVTLTGVIGVLEAINVHNFFHYQIGAAPIAINTNTTSPICQGGSITLTANTSTSGHSFAWSNGATTPSITVDAAGDYSVTVTNAAACAMSSVPFAVQLHPQMNIASTVNDVTCNGSNNGSIALNVTSGSGTYSYAWAHGGSAASLSDLVAGSYRVTVTDQGTACTKTDTIEVAEPLLLSLTPSVVNISCAGGDGEITLAAVGGTAPYVFSSASTVLANIISGLDSGSYTILVTDQNLCTHTAQVVVGNGCGNPGTTPNPPNPDDDDDGISINIHNVITPNSDGINDVFVIKGLDKFPSNSIKIFNKWGDMVYEESDYRNNWSGYSNRSSGGNLPAGTYFYLLEIANSEAYNIKGEYTGYLLIQR